MSDRTDGLDGTTVQHVDGARDTDDDGDGGGHRDHESEQRRRADVHQRRVYDNVELHRSDDRDGRP